MKSVIDSKSQDFVNQAGQVAGYGIDKALKVKRYKDSK